MRTKTEEGAALVQGEDVDDEGKEKNPRGTRANKERMRLMDGDRRR